MRVADVLGHPRREVETISPAETVANAIKRFLDSHVRALVVVEGDRLEGIITVRDVMTHIDAHGAESIQHRVSEFMTKEPISVDSETLLDEVQRVFVEKGIHHLIVVDKGKLVGLVTPPDVLGRHVDHIQHLNEHLTAYISGTADEPGET